MGFSAKDLGIDLGTANTIIYNPEAGVILNEATAIAYDKYTGEIIATGTKAKAMYGKAPRNIEVIKPLQDGVISDFDMTAEMLQIFIRQATEERKPAGLRVVVGVPSGVTEVEKRAVLEVVREVGGKEVYVMDEPMAAAIGAGLDIEASEASMIADIGGGTTDVAILSLGGLVVSTSLRYAGLGFRLAIDAASVNPDTITDGTNKPNVIAPVTTVPVTPSNNDNTDNSYNPSSAFDNQRNDVTNSPNFTNDNKQSNDQNNEPLPERKFKFLPFLRD